MVATPRGMTDRKSGGRWLDRIARIVAAVILLQTLYFKFTGSEESVYIFTTLSVEPWGRLSLPKSPSGRGKEGPSAGLGS